ncbi:endonuclease/exonuclease/phosphatase family protein [Paenibacillus medicaginis]|uniref:Endonuclease/exonuclease/phosphatase family protein n=1 Tax=Paenibacillus medicaginis TaxID=1470560 RepID=A0ABV5BVQ5_9BACL
MSQVKSLFSRLICAMLAVVLSLPMLGLFAQKAHAADYTMAANKPVYWQGESVEVTYSGAVNEKDWIAVYEASNDNLKNYLEWHYTGTGEGTLTFNTSSLKPGDYTLRFLVNDGYQVEESTSFTIEALPAPSGLSLDAVIGGDKNITGDVTITPPANNKVIQNYKLYWGGTSGMLPGVPEVTTVTYAAYQKDVMFTFQPGTVVPEGATSLLAYSEHEGLQSQSFARALLPGYVTPDEVDLTVMSFNIWQGPVKSKYGVDGAAQHIANAIRESGADVAGIQETDRDIVVKAAQLLGYQAAVKSGSDLSLISKYPIIEVDEANDYYLIEVVPDKAVAIGNIHLSSSPYGPYDIQEGKTVEAVLQNENMYHMTEMKSMFNKLPVLAAQGMPVFLTGDFNVPSHLDWVEGNKNRHSGQTVEWPVSKKLEELGFQDSYRVVHSDPVAEPTITWAAEGTEWKNPEMYDRIDYVYSHGPAVVKNSQVYGEKQVAGGNSSSFTKADVGLDTWVSDHRAVVSTFTVTPRSYNDLELPKDPEIEKATISLEKNVFAHGEPITVSYKGAQSLTDWIGIYKKDESPGGPASQKWDYVPSQPDGKLTLDDNSEGKVATMADIAPGEYFVTLLLNGGYQENTERIYFKITTKTTPETPETPETPGTPTTPKPHDSNDDDSDDSSSGGSSSNGSVSKPGQEQSKPGAGSETNPETTPADDDEQPAKPSTAVESVFTDIDSSFQAIDALQSMFDKGVIKGIDGSKFNGNGKLNRADSVIMLNRLFNIAGQSGTSFADVKPNSYYANDIAAANQLGLVNGTSSGRFNPAGKIRKLDYLVMFYRYLNHQGRISNPQEMSSLNAAALNNVPGYAQQAIHYFLNVGFLKPDSSNLYNELTRTDAVVLLAQLNEQFLEE